MAVGDNEPPDSQAWSASIASCRTALTSFRSFGRLWSGCVE